MNPTFTFDADLYLWKDDGSWVFLDVPVDVSDEIHEIVPDPGGFGSVPVSVHAGSSDWQTSVFPDSKRECFVLPIKKAIRLAGRVDVGDSLRVELTVRLG
ncbi:MAG: DUF1905 domain-containing protein [Actinomycetota bacterium]